jgi:hypothetical protein
MNQPFLQTSAETPDELLLTIMYLCPVFFKTVQYLYVYFVSRDSKNVYKACILQWFIEFVILIIQ